MLIPAAATGSYTEDQEEEKKADLHRWITMSGQTNPPGMAAMRAYPDNPFNTCG
jgi:hypothetical protein